MYGQPGPLSQLDRERLAAGARYYSGIPPPHGLGIDPNDPMVSYSLRWMDVIGQPRARIG